jgi:hypothetical protein
MTKSWLVSFARAARPTERNARRLARQQPVYVYGGDLGRPDFAQEWILAARRACRPSDDTRVVSLHKNLGDNVVPLHTNQDDYDDS